MRFRFLHPWSRSQSGQRSKLYLINNSKTTEANLTILYKKIKHNETVVVHKSKVPMPKVKVTIKSEIKLCQILCCSSTTAANLIKLHRKIKHNEKACSVQDLGSYAQAQGHSSEVKIVSKQ